MKTVIRLAILMIITYLPNVGVSGAYLDSQVNKSNNVFSSGHWSRIRLNEILYNPSGNDDQDKPSGEWVELYNPDASPVNVEGWTIKNSAGHSWTIAATNSDNNSNPADSGESVVPAHGYLVTYNTTHAELFSNGGDTVSLYENHGSLIDSHTYSGGKAEEQSEQRIPDGTGPWVDPTPTPCAKNELDAPSPKINSEEVKIVAAKSDEASPAAELQASPSASETFYEETTT